MFNAHVTRTGLATLFRLNFFYSTIFIMFTSTVAKAESIVSTTKAMGGKAEASALFLGHDYSLMLQTDGSVWGTGNNIFGQLGDGTKTMKRFFTITMTRGVYSACAGGFHSLLVKQDGSAWGTGRNLNGQLGDGTKDNRISFVQIMPDSTQAVAAGGSHSLLLKSDGSVWSTGSNMHGQLGDGSTTNKITFEKVIGDAQAIAAGQLHSLVLKHDGSVWATGWNNFGQLGDNSICDSNNFKKVMDPQNGSGSTFAKAVAAGYGHSLILKQDGTVWTAGNNLYGQLGDGSNIDKSTFEHVFSDAKAVAAGFGHSLVLKEDSSVWATGSQCLWNGEQLYGSTGVFKQQCCDSERICDDIRRCVLAFPVTTTPMITPITTSSTKTVAAIPTTTVTIATTKLTAATTSTSRTSMAAPATEPRPITSSLFPPTESKATTKSITHTATCPKCGTSKRGRASCCLRGGAWSGNCGDFGDSRFAYTWFDGIEACKATTTVEAIVNERNTGITSADTIENTGTCPKCGKSKNGRASCCLRGGAWSGNCGDFGDSRFAYTWFDGLEACKATTTTAEAIANDRKKKNTGVTSADTVENTGTCPKCGISKNGRASCCFKGASWFNQCGDVGDSRFEHTWFEGIEACKPTTTTVEAISNERDTGEALTDTIENTGACPKCGKSKNGRASCCLRGGAWSGNCGDVGDSRFAHTWFEGIEACKRITAPLATTTEATTVITSKITTRADTAQATAAVTATKADTAQATAVVTATKADTAQATAVVTATKADTAQATAAVTTTEANTATTSKVTTRADATETGTVVSTTKAITTTDAAASIITPEAGVTMPLATTVKDVITCPKCSISKRGRASCCFKGGSWFKQCGDLGDLNFPYTWFDGTEACKVKTTVNAIGTEATREAGQITPAMPTDNTPSQTITCPKCGISKKGKSSCCFRGASWFKQCGDVGDTTFEHTWFEGVEACSAVTSESNERELLRQRISAFQKETVLSARERQSKVSVSNSKGFLELARHFFFMDVLFISLFLSM